MVQHATVFTNVATDTVKLALCTDGMGFMMQLRHPIGISVEDAFPHYEFKYSSNMSDFASAVKNKCRDYIFDYCIVPRLESLTKGMAVEDVKCIRRRIRPLTATIAISDEMVRLTIALI